MIKDPKGIKETNYNTTGAWVSAPIVSKIIKRMTSILSIPPVESNKLYKAQLKKL